MPALRKLFDVGRLPLLLAWLYKPVPARTWRAPVSVVEEFVAGDIYQKLKSVPRPKRRGRTRLASTELLDLLAVIYYQRWLIWLQARKRRSGLVDSRTVEWWQGQLHERAARIVAKLLGCRNISYRAILNLVSKSRYGGRFRAEPSGRQFL
jgi:hypothetical protein